jgi:hypothetical protein
VENCDEKFDPNSEVDAEMSEAMEELRMAKLFNNKEGIRIALLPITTVITTRIWKNLRMKSQKKKRVYKGFY